MGCVNLTARQAREIAKFLEFTDNSESVWIHGELESIFVEKENSSGRTIEQKRFFENGVIQTIVVDF